MDAREALAKLDPTPNHTFRWLASSVARQVVSDDGPVREPAGGYRDPASPKPARERALAAADRRRAAEKLGFTRLGAMRSRILYLPPIDAEVFVDATATVTLSMGPRLEAFCTNFDDGTCLMTWSQLPKSGPRNEPTKATTRAIARTGDIGSGDLPSDLAIHQASVARRVSAGRTPLCVHDIGAYVELGNYYLRREIPLASAWTYVLTAAVAIAIPTLGVAYLATLLVR